MNLGSLKPCPAPPDTPDPEGEGAEDLEVDDAEAVECADPPASAAAVIDPVEVDVVEVVVFIPEADGMLVDEVAEVVEDDREDDDLKALC